MILSLNILIKNILIGKSVSPSNILVKIFQLIVMKLLNMQDKKLNTPIVFDSIL